ncbi:MAG: Undecaprenyl-phosphate 4-deoxy-4-formamido-L-arabinose transferase [Phycisphaerae bacterium]|nr:Undecaprenyl-phosphate 4-deoxy-4-formamido-L-arabinose transferase [Phycisphaerae bacterium]
MVLTATPASRTGCVEVSVVVPTFREADNVAELSERLFAALAGAGLSAELILVDDDSGDGIERVVEASPHSELIRLIVRRGERGLSSAVLRGLAEARGRWLVVMDADLSHPPEMVPELVGPLRDGQADMVVGSRYAEGGSLDSQWSWWRRANSRMATRLARPFAPVSDPMSGFFALERATVDQAAFLNPIGYKIGLELLVKCRCRRVREVPIHFTDRQRGQSKFGTAEQFRYLEHLSRLYDFKYPRLVPVIKFLIVVTLGLLGGYGWIALGYAIGGEKLILAAYLSAFWPAIAFNALAYWRYVQQMRGRTPIRRPLQEFLILSGLEWIGYTATAQRWLDGQPVPGWPRWLLLAWIPFAMAFVLRFLLRKLAGHDIRGLPKRQLPEP